MRFSFAFLALWLVLPPAGRTEVRWCTGCGGPLGADWCAPTKEECLDTLERCRSAAGGGWDGCPCPTRCYKHGEEFHLDPSVRVPVADKVDPRGPAPAASDPRGPATDSEGQAPTRAAASSDSTTSPALPKCQEGFIAVRRAFGTEPGFHCVMIVSLKGPSCSAVPSEAVGRLVEADRVPLSRLCPNLFAARSALPPSSQSSTGTQPRPAPEKVPFGSLFVALSMLATFVGGMVGTGWFSAFAWSILGAFFEATEKLGRSTVIRQSVNPATGLAISGHHLEMPFEAFGHAAGIFSALTVGVSQILELSDLWNGKGGLQNRVFKCAASIGTNVISFAVGGVVMGALFEAGPAAAAGFIAASVLGMLGEGAKVVVYRVIDYYVP